VLLRAASEIDGVVIDIAGDGPERKRLEALAAELGVEARFHGFVQGELKTSLLEQADVLCAPSREVAGLSEGAPLVIVEAQAMGLPVVASRVGGIPELVGERPDHRLVPPGDPKALAAALRKALGAVGDARIARAG
jgi:glycosyltransferase involved in cell wall biosynthesis